MRHLRYAVGFCFGREIVVGSGIVRRRAGVLELMSENDVDGSKLQSAKYNCLFLYDALIYECEVRARELC
jgi:hypothetical protein